MAECKLIVHADDFGLSEKVNEGIIEAHCNGILTSTSIMSVGAAFDHAIELSQTVPTLDIGIHLTLAEEEPISNKEDIKTLLNSNGRFHDHAVTFVKRYLLGKISQNEVKHELEAQIQKVLGHSIEVSHLDSHQHIHMLPGIRSIVGKLAKKYFIPAIRYPREQFKPYMFYSKNGARRLLQLLALNTFCTLANTSDARRPDHFLGFFFGGNVHEENLWKILLNLPASGTFELMCHPGNCDTDCRYDHWNYHWKDELSALTKQDVKDFLERKGIELISYANLDK